MLGHELQGFLVLRLGQGFVGREHEVLAVLLAQAVGAQAPAGLVEQLPGLGLVKDQLGRQVHIACCRGCDHRTRLGVAWREEGFDDLLGIGAMQQGLAHLEIGHQRVVGADGDAVVHAARGRRVDAELLLLHALFVIGLDLADEAGLAGQQCAYAHAVLGRDDELDFIQACAALVSQLGRAPAVVLARLEHQFLAQGLAGHHEGARTYDACGIAKLLEWTIQRGRRDQARADHRSALEKARRGFLEEEFHGQRIDDFAAFVIVDDLGNRLLERLVAETVGIEVACHGGSVQRQSVREAHAGAQLEAVLGGIGVHGPGFGDPGLDLQRLGVLVGQLVRDLVEHAAVGIEAAGRRVEIGVCLLFEIDQSAALNRFRRGAGLGRAGLPGAAGQQHAARQYCHCGP